MSLKNLPTNAIEQLEQLKILCEQQGINYGDLDKMLEAEQVKKLQKRNHYIQQTITQIIEERVEDEI